jgi:hypothetical protein
VTSAAPSGAAIVHNDLMRDSLWRTVVALGTAQTLAYASTYYLPALVASPMARDLGVSRSMVLLAFSVALVVSALIGPWAGRAIDRHGGRRVLPYTSLLFAAGLVALAAARGPVSLFAAWTLLGLAMGAGLYETAFAALVRLYGPRSRQAITGITLIAGFASTVGWPLTAWWLTLWDWRGACLAWAALHLVLGWPLNARLPRGQAPGQRDARRHAARRRGRGASRCGCRAAPRAIGDDQVGDRAHEQQVARQRAGQRQQRPGLGVSGRRQQQHHRRHVGHQVAEHTVAANSGAGSLQRHARRRQPGHACAASPVCWKAWLTTNRPMNSTSSSQSTSPSASARVQLAAEQQHAGADQRRHFARPVGEQEDGQQRPPPSAPWRSARGRSGLLVGPPRRSAAAASPRGRRQHVQRARACQAMTAPGRQHASTITRSSGSVPLARISTRPLSPSSASTACCSAARRVLARQSAPGLQAHVDQHLREQRHVGQQLGQGAAAAHTGLQHLQRADQAVAGGVLVQHQQVARALAAQHPAALRQLFEHIAVADLGAHELDAARAQRHFDRHVGHQRADHAGHALARRAGRRSRHHGQVQQFVAVEQAARRRPPPAGGRRRRPARRRSRRRVALTARTSASGWVAPTPWLMFRPSGAQPMATTSAPSSWNTLGAIW